MRHIKVQVFIFFSFIFLSLIILGYTGRDDSHIPYFVSQIFGEKFKLLNYNGDLIEQSSSLLFSLILGVLVSITGIMAPTLGPIVSLTFFVASYFSALTLIKRIGAGPLPLLSFYTLPSVYWSLSGMENSLYLFLFFLLAHSVISINIKFLEKRNNYQDYFLTALFTLLLTLTRPEFIVVCIVAIGLFGLLSYKSLTNYFQVAGSMIVGVIGAVTIRNFLGLGLFPNTVSAKNHDLIYQTWLGLRYIYRTIWAVPISSFLALIFFLICCLYLLKGNFNSKILQFVRLYLSLIVAMVAFAIFAGGDWMEAGRFLTVPISLSVFFGGIALNNNLSAKSLISILLILVFDLFLVARTPVGGFPYFKSYEVDVMNYKPSSFEFRNMIHARDIKFIDKTLTELRGEGTKNEPIVIASIQAGMVPYYLMTELKETIYFIDLKGLSTQEVFGCRGGKGYFNHNPYVDLLELQNCMGIKFDYVYDLDFKDWRRLNHLLDIGCQEVFREELAIDPQVGWKDSLISRQFLVKCADN